MSKLKQHLQKHLSGEVIESSEVLEYFSTDGSIFRLQPKMVVYPRNAEDVRKVVRLSWQLAERGKTLPITARGKGTDQAGAALGRGVMLAFPARMRKMIDLDEENVTVEPGILYGDLQRTLKSHGRFLPPYPSSIDFSTIGGAVANNAAGEKTIKYGCTRDYVKALKVVLANGQLITAKKLSAKEVNKKKGQADFEGEVYRKLDGLLEDGAELIKKAQPHVTKNSAGYNLVGVRGKDGSMDLSKLFVGSQGTLGVVTEITLKTAPFNPDTHLLAIYFDDLEKAGEAVVELMQLEPSAMEVVDEHLLRFIRKHDPHRLEGLIPEEIPKLVLLVEFDDKKESAQKRKAKKAARALKGLANAVKVSTDKVEQAELWKIRHSAAAVICQTEGKKKALPIIEDGTVPVEKLPEFLHKVYELFDRYHLDIAVWGHAGNGNFHMQPMLDLSNVGDRQTVFTLMDEYYDLVINLGGSTCGEHNDGRLRAPYLSQLYGQEMYELFRQVKAAFDPFDILNPGVKIDVKKEDIKGLMREEYSMPHLYEHLPHS